MLFLFTTCIVLYLFLVFAILYGLFGGLGVRERLVDAPIGKMPFISVIIPAKNEALAIGTVLTSLAAQEYDRDLFEVIVVDDHSKDGTSDVAMEKASIVNSLSVIKVSDEATALYGKQNAIDAGVLASKGNYIVCTDADCELDSGFLKSYAEAFAKGADLAFSWTLLWPAKTIFERLQASDLCFLFTVAAGTARLNVPLSCMGNNIGFTKGSYQALGGYKELGPSPVEDYQLLSAYRKIGRRIRYIGSPEPLVRTAPVNNFKSFLYQRVRWARGAMAINPGINLLTLIALFANTLTIYCFASLIWGGFVIGAVLGVIKILTDYLMFTLGKRYFRRDTSLADFPIWEAYYLFSPIIYLFFMMFIPKRKWR